MIQERSDSPTHKNFPKFQISVPLGPKYQSHGSRCDLYFLFVSIGLAYGLSFSDFIGHVDEVFTTRGDMNDLAHRVLDLSYTDDSSRQVSRGAIIAAQNVLGQTQPPLENLQLNVAICYGNLGEFASGPSKGLAHAASYISFVRKRAPNKVACSGAVSLAGAVSRVENVGFKCVAAIRAGFEHIILPMENKACFKKLDDEAKTKIKAHYIKNISELPALLFEDISNV